MGSGARAPRVFALASVPRSFFQSPCGGLEKWVIRKLGSVTGSPREGDGLLSHARPYDFCNCIRHTDASSNGASSRPKQVACFGFPRDAYFLRSTLCEEASRLSPTSSKAGPSFLGDARATRGSKGRAEGCSARPKIAGINRVCLGAEIRAEALTTLRAA